MTKTEIMRQQVLGLLKRVPFSPIEICLENGERLLVEHPELMAYDPGERGRPPMGKFAVISNGITYTSTFESVTSVAEIDYGQPIGDR